MPPFLVLTPSLRRLSDGSFFRTAFPAFLRGCAVLGVVAALYGSYLLWKGPSGGEGFNFFLALLLAQLLILALGFTAFNVFWVRAADCDELPEAGGSVTPAVAVALRAFSEVAAAAQVLGGLAIAVLGWLGQPWVAARIFGPIWMAPGSSGVAAILWGCAYGFVLLAGGYFVAEQVTAWWATERNTRRS
jgi:hypothetical protein